MKKMLATATFGFAMAGTVASADIPADITATLTVYQWDNPQIVTSTGKAIERFASQYPNVTVVPMFGTPANGWGEYSNGFLNELATGNKIDLFATAIEGFAEIASKGILVNLDEVVAQNPDAAAVFEEIDANLLDGMRSRETGELNYFPTEWNNIVVYYNMDMFDEAGIAYPSDDWNWEDFLAAAKATTVRDDSGEVTQFGFAFPSGNFGLQPWLLTNDTGYLASDWKTVTVMTPEFRESLEFMHSVIHEHGAAPIFSRSGYQDDKFAAKQIAMFTAGHWPVPEVKASGLTRVGVVSFPRNKSASTVFGIGGIGILKGSENPELAWEFLREITGEVYQQELADSERSIPSWRRFATTPEWTAYPENSEIFYASAATAIAVPSPSNFAQMEEIFMRHLEAYLTDNQDIDATIEGMNREMTRSMSRVDN